MIDFDALIGQYLRTEARPKVIGRYYPSEVGQCLRKSWYSYKAPRETDPSVLKVFEAGNRVHAFVVDVLRSDKVPAVELVETEVPVLLDVGEFVVSGRIDNIVKLKDDDRLVLVEVKSTSSVHLTTEAKKAHVMQLQLYLHALKMLEGMVLYIEKNTLKSKVFPVAYDAAFVESVLDRFRVFHKSLVENALPEPEGRLVEEMNWMCKACPWRKECYEATPEPVSAGSQKTRKISEYAR